MSHVPLAVDIHGAPIRVPDTATHWRVRRQTGGRPGPVFGPDGLALKLPLDATVHDLRGYGCAPGTYRLDAIDERERVVGATAHAHVEADVVEPSPPPLHSGPRDPAIDGLVRVMEAMQRSQAEQNKAVMQLAMAVVDRGADKQVDVLGAVRQALRIEDEITEAVNRRQDQIHAATPEPVVVAPPPPVDVPVTDRILTFVNKAAELAKVFGIDPAVVGAKFSDMVSASTAASSPTPGADTHGAPAGPPEQDTPPPEAQPESAGAEPLPAPLDTSAPAVREKMRAIWKELSKAEREGAAELVKQMSPSLLKQVEVGLLAMPVGDAVAYLRRQLHLRRQPPSATGEGGAGAAAAVG